jgi:hypothetical protein
VECLVKALRSKVEPLNIPEVEEQVQDHPYYSWLSTKLKLHFEADRRDPPRCCGLNRALWRHLYKDYPIPLRFLNEI